MAAWKDDGCKNEVGSSKLLLDLSAREFLSARFSAGAPICTTTASTTT